MQMENGRSPNEKYLHDFTYHGKEFSFSEAKEVLSPYFDGSGSVDLEKDDNGIAKICINNPRLKNAISVKMMSDLDEITDKLYQWTECKGAIVYGTGGNFCSGGDLKMAKKMNNEKNGYAMSVYMGHILDKFKKLPIISVAYIDGTGALGGGAEVTTMCDYRLMCNVTDTTGIGFVHSKMGIVPAWGATGRLVSITGSAKKTLDLLLEGRTLNAVEAMDLGLVDGTVASLEDAGTWLSNKVRQDVNVIRAIKRTVLSYDDDDDSKAKARELERKIFAPLWGGIANQAALKLKLKHNR
ncbi:ethylmalonyl-CoA decarboxylase-like [Myzus persicae]|uniref:ethylmalonyl-CoA decarboxylase-like n=1 Tax=Myzus persicae TaxID=13164 RepID=UPI000B930EB1|nr:ethylmalonyl-CoA decarboxylase-like [Myzus persicae]XP_022174079.1 ethylmalonyl-CoA decarboxylase-like [Myzus persicae]